MTFFFLFFTNSLYFVGVNYNPPQLTCPDSGRAIYAHRGETKAIHSWSEPTATGDNLGPYG